MINNIFIVIGLVLLAISFVLLGSQIFNAYPIKEILFAKEI
jgi:protein-S-isoprenylcysteine O-methyltransferase Ste14